MEKEPEEYPRRILLAVSGLSPQIITETVYGLAVQRRPRFVPTEVHLLTTIEGAERARLNLLSVDPGWFARLRREYGLPEIAFSTSNIHVLQDAAGNPMADIRTDQNNQCAADGITECLRRFTSDPESAIHVSMAGGRKTMGFFAAYALSLLGRPQDRLSHVLVSAAFESHPGFFYPTRESHVIFTPPPDSRPLDTSAAEITLAEIPFVRLRDWLPAPVREGGSSYLRTVTAARCTLEGATLKLDHSCCGVEFGQVRFTLAPAEFAFLCWMARRRVDGLVPIACPSEGAPEPAYALAYLKEYNLLPVTQRDRTSRALSGGMEKSFFLERKARLNRVLQQNLALQAALLDLRVAGRRPSTVYGLRLDAQRISFAGASLRSQEHE